MAQRYFVPMRLWSTTSDPGSPGNGDLWMRSDLAKVRGHVSSTTVNLATETYTQTNNPWLPRITSGRWYRPAGLGGVSAGTPTSGTMYLTPFWPGKAGTVNGIAWEITTQAVAAGTDDSRFGLYADSGGGVPTGAAIFDSGLQNNEVVAGVKTLAVSWSNLSAELYWLAYVRQQTGALTTAAQLRLHAASDLKTMVFSDASATPVIGTGLPCNYTQTGVTGALPTIGTLALSTSTSPIILIKYA